MHSRQDDAISGGIFTKKVGRCFPPPDERDDRVDGHTSGQKGAPRHLGQLACEHQQPQELSGERSNGQVFPLAAK